MDVPHLRLAPGPSGLAATAAAEDSIRVVLAEDHALMRRSLRLLLDSEEGVEVIDEASDLAPVVRRVDGHQPRVLVLGLGMPDGSGSGAIRGLRERAPEMQIVIVTMEENRAFVQRALAAGAIGFVLKDLADEELPTAIRLAARGEPYVSPRLALRLDDVHRARTGNMQSEREVGGVAAGRLGTGTTCRELAGAADPALASAVGVP
jgi:two-component system, NarL family, response regulator NreC